MKPIGYAFWSYDLFPYLVGGEFDEIVEGGLVHVPSYNGRAKPLFILDVKSGRKLRDRLAELRTAHREAVGAVNREFQKNLETIVTDAGGKLK
jgi:hypothetical protein